MAVLIQPCLPENNKLKFGRCQFLLKSGPQVQVNLDMASACHMYLLSTVTDSMLQYTRRHQQRRNRTDQHKTMTLKTVKLAIDTERSCRPVADSRSTLNRCWALFTSTEPSAAILLPTVSSRCSLQVAVRDYILLLLFPGTNTSQLRQLITDPVLISQRLKVVIHHMETSEGLQEALDCYPICSSDSQRQLFHNSFNF